MPDTPEFARLHFCRRQALAGGNQTLSLTLVTWKADKQFGSTRE
jgi:hypothetical protein